MLLLPPAWLASGGIHISDPSLATSPGDSPSCCACLFAGRVLEDAPPPRSGSNCRRVQACADNVQAQGGEGVHLPGDLPPPSPAPTAFQLLILAPPPPLLQGLDEVYTGGRQEDKLALDVEVGGWVGGEGGRVGGMGACMRTGGRVGGWLARVLSQV